MNKKIKLKAKKRAVKSPIQKKDLVFRMTGPELPDNIESNVAKALKLARQHKNLCLLIGFQESDGEFMLSSATHNATLGLARQVVNEGIKKFGLLPPELADLASKLDGEQKQGKAN